MAEKFLANVGRALIFKGNSFYGVANTLTENTFAFSASPNEVRGGKSNPLIGRWFSDSTMTVTLTNATFRLDYLAMTLGTTIEQGGVSVYESAAAGETVATAGEIALTKTPAAFNGTMIGWYKAVGASDWTIGTITGTSPNYKMNITGAQVGAKYCIKYFYEDANARLMTIPADFDPDELHVVIINDLYNADINTNSSASVVGQLITDIPRLGLDPSQNLTLTATSSAPTQLTGTALRYIDSDGCEVEASYGSMVERIDGSVWQENVVAIAAADNNITLAASGTATAVMYAVFGGSMPSKMYDNSNFTFAVDSGTSATVNNAGVITADASATGVTTISVNLTGYTTKVDPAYIKVTVGA